jgi:hypothetical protein
VASAEDISTTAPSAGSVNLLTNDTDATAIRCTVNANTQGTKGAVPAPAATVTYTPNAGTSGSDSFNLLASAMARRQATVTLR